MIKYGLRWFNQTAPMIRPGGQAGVSTAPPGSTGALTTSAPTATTMQLAFTDASGATSHEYRLDGVGSWLALAGNKIVTGLTQNTTYGFQVRGVNSGGNGTASGSANGTTQLTETDTWATAVAALTTAPTTARRALVNTMIAALKVDGTWSVLDRLGFAGANELTSTVCVKAPAKTFTFSGGYTFLADRYWQGNGSNGFINFNELPAAAGANNFALNTASFFFGINVAGVEATNVAPMGQSGGTNTLRGGARIAAGNETFSINDANGSTAQSWPGTRLGRRAYSRTSSTVKRAFYQGVRTADITSTSTSISTGNIVVGRSVNTYMDCGFNVWGSGGGLTDAQVATLDAAVLAFMTAIGSN